MPLLSPGVPAQLFYSYSHKDEKLRDQLEAHLSTLKRENRISAWHDRRITAGTEWKGEIDERLKSSSQSARQAGRVARRRQSPWTGRQDRVIC